jgi:predicted nuclease of restriction endonuclease-like (RecB) superfamily
MSKLPDNIYDSILTGLKEKFRTAQIKAALSVNAYQLALYWEVGFTILQQREEEGWGTKIIERLSRDLKIEFPGMKGISTRNITYMRDFAEAYPEYPFVQQAVADLSNIDNQAIVILQQLVAKLPWGHHIAIFTRLKTREERLFYMQKCAENNWGRDFLKMQIDNKLHLRKGAAITNFKNTLPEATSDLARDILKSPYMFDFIAMSEKMQEREVEKALITHMKSFMLELGKGFAYVGNQYNLKVEGDDYFLDLLFYNTHLHCYVIFELKVGEFKPEYAGKLNFYINTVDAQIKGEHDAPTFGVLLCKTPNETVVKFALEGIKTPIGVAEYQLADALPKQLKLEMPSIEELEAEIEKEYEELKNPAEKKMDRIKELINKLGDEKLSERKNDAKTLYLFRTVFKAQQQMIWNVIQQEIVPMFQDVIHSWRIENYGFQTADAAEQQLLKHPSSHEFYYELRLEGFLDAGVNTFNCYAGFKFHLDHYHYQAQDRYAQGGTNIYKKLYHQNPSHEEMMGLVEKYKMDLLNQIEENLERITKEKK